MSKFSDRLKELGFANYDEYLDSNLWRDFRTDYYSKHISKCEVCPSPQTELHHNNYDRLGKEEFADMNQLCRTHHQAVHDWLKQKKKGVWCTKEAIKALWPRSGQVAPSYIRKGKTFKRPMKLGKLERSCNGIANEIRHLLREIESSPEHEESLNRLLSTLDRNGLLAMRNGIRSPRPSRKSLRKQKENNRAKKSIDRYWEEERKAQKAKHKHRRAPQPINHAPKHPSENALSPVAIIDGFYRQLSQKGIVQRSKEAAKARMKRRKKKHKKIRQRERSI